MHCSQKRVLRRGLEFHVCTINKSVHSKQYGNLFNDPHIFIFPNSHSNLCSFHHFRFNIFQFDLFSSFILSVAPLFFFFFQAILFCSINLFKISPPFFLSVCFRYFCSFSKFNFFFYHFFFYLSLFESSYFFFSFFLM